MYIEVTNKENEVVAVMTSSIELFLKEEHEDGTKAKIILTSGRALNTKETFAQIKTKIEDLNP
jgi:electron transfer flavoprotein alpha subunit